MRDPWFPILLILIVLVTVWLGIFGPLPDGFAKWLQGWQTLIGASVAVVAATIAYWNTNRSLAHSEKLETRRRRQKQTALRAMLPLALAQVGAYAEQTAKALQTLITQCDQETLPFDVVQVDFVKPLPSETLKSFSEFIEYSDEMSVDVIASTVAMIQIHDSRLRGILQDNHDPSRSRVIVRSDLERSIVDGTIIYAGGSSGFNYARRRQDSWPDELTWDEVIRALRNMGFFDDEHPRLHEDVERRATQSRGPFDLLRTR
ncbi:hypothetical protein NLM33_46560 [Bradyrhizobium sp. CCGUVB1N3]|uniref:hypothetical protein n=1 Tax=Bradyrhizobium sp. CCGUVB1N3 TaxID=2949629 RepID=UPI0020B4573E|nr:hypothetical protein [Bradyrhizobium sp. CCGUVB1N3]MCP3477621.1 hypothetical protein [Bradyrhizobium sp. CCGUVB1N3]